MSDESCPSPLVSVPASLHRVVIAGFGPVGRCVAEQLSAAGVEVTVIDMNAQTIDRQRALGLKAVHGDASDPAVLHAAEIERADALILAIPNEEAAVKACAEARKLAPHLFIAARTNFVSRGMLATKAGADHVTVEELVTAEAMRNAVVKHFLEL